VHEMENKARLALETAPTWRLNDTSVERLRQQMD
jgi:hypothetical protein